MRREFLVPASRPAACPAWPSACCPGRAAVPTETTETLPDAAYRCIVASLG
jgi:hypothetical protein